MGNYVDLVLARPDGMTASPTNLYIWRAPQFSNFKKGDLLLVDSSIGEKKVIVEASATIGIESEELDMILKTTGERKIETVNKVLGVFKYNPVKWEDEE